MQHLNEALSPSIYPLALSLEVSLACTGSCMPAHVKKISCRCMWRRAPTAPPVLAHTCAQYREISHAREEDLLPLYVEARAHDVARAEARPVGLARLWARVQLLPVRAVVPVAVGLPPGSGSKAGLMQPGVIHHCQHHCLQRSMPKHC